MDNFYLMPSKGTYSESLRYSTSMFESINGTKNSKKLVTYPKNTCKYSALAFYTEKHRGFINGFREGLIYTVIHPLWGRGALITSNNTGTTIYCITSNSDFKVGADVFLVESYDKYSVLTIVEVLANSIVVNLSVETFEGRLVLPTFLGVLTGEVNSTYTGENYALCDINVEELR